MTDFQILGPFPVTCERNPAGRTITPANARSFWVTHGTVSDQRGVYVFGMRAGRGVTPAYVGKATKSFGQEVFTPHKLNKYHQCLTRYRKGTPILFFVASPPARGKPNNSHIGELELFLIQAGLSVNVHLLNERGVRRVPWTIAGVIGRVEAGPARQPKPSDPR